MIKAIIIILLFFAAWYWLLPVLKRAFTRYMMGKAEDTMRRMMGMPSRKEEERMRKSTGEQQKKESPKSRWGRRRAAEAADFTYDLRGVRISQVLQAYAVDIEFTEYREFSATTESEIKYTFEQQVADVEYYIL